MSVDPNDPSVSPVELRAPIGAVQIEIDWEDGTTSILHNRYLRGFCPCAGCQGHSGPISFMDGGDLRLVDVSEISHYAVEHAWRAVHNAGRYSFWFRLALADASREGDIPARTVPR